LDVNLRTGQERPYHRPTDPKLKIEYANKYFADYEKHFMLWSPIVKNQGPKAKHNQLQDIARIQDILNTEYGETIEPVMNHEYAKCLGQLRAYAAKETKELKSPILRLMQIEEKLAKHLQRLDEATLGESTDYREQN